MKMWTMRRWSVTTPPVLSSTWTSVSIWTTLVFLLSSATSGFSQTELFEQDVSGIHPYAALKWNSKITEPLLGFEYVLEGRLAVGAEVGTPLKDTAFSMPGTDSLIASKFHAYFFNPYLQVEVMGSADKDLSLSVRGDFIYENTPADSHGNDIVSSGFGLGPVLVYRIRVGDQTYLIPRASYEFFYDRWKRNWVTYDNGPGNAPGHFDDEYFLQHNLALSTDVEYWLTETQGFNFEPKALFEFGDGLRKSDLVNIGVQAGYLLAF
jgi:hypothetical protein